MRGSHFLIACSAASLLSMSSLASADANHQILSQAPIKSKSGRVIGFRATVLLDPQELTSKHSTLGGDVRLGLGSMKYVNVDSANYNHHRDAVAGVSPGYLVHQFKMREITGPNPEDRGPLVETLHTDGQQKEVEVEVLYKNNPTLIPGTKADLVAGFWKSSYWHIWGAAEGPMHSSNDFVVQLPGKTTPANLKRGLAALAAEEAKAKMKVDSMQAQVDSAQTMQQAAMAAYQAASASLQAANTQLQSVKTVQTKAQGHVTIATSRADKLRADLAALEAMKTKKGKAETPAETPAEPTVEPATPDSTP